jgi:hypothetical protein
MLLEEEKPPESGYWDFAPLRNICSKRDLSYRLLPKRWENAVEAASKPRQRQVGEVSRGAYNNGYELTAVIF